MPAFAVKPRVMMSSSTNLFHAPPPHHHHDTPVVTSFNHRRYNSIQRSVYLSQTRLMSISDASSSSPERTFILRFDSTVDRDTKDAGLGIAIYDSVDGSTLWSGHRFLPVIGSGDKKDMGNITSNVADYMALLDGLRIIDNLMNSDSNTSQTPSRRVEIQTANEVIAKHLIGTFKCTSKNLKPWYDRVSKSIRESFDNVNVEKIDRVESKFVKKESMTAVKERRSGESYMTMVQELKRVANESSRLTQQATTVQHNAIKKQPVDDPPHVQPMEDQKQASSVAIGGIDPERVYVLRFDGGSRGNPGIAGCGMVLYDSDDGSEIWSGYHYLGDKNTNNEAEYMGLITGLQCARSLGIKNIVVQGDSKLILSQVEGKYQVKSPNLKQYYAAAISLVNEFESCETSHILRGRNGRADELANEAMDTQTSKGFNYD